MTNQKKTGIEHSPCGCTIDHDKQVISPCDDHVLAILAKLSEDNGGCISFSKE